MLRKRQFMYGNVWLTPDQSCVGLAVWSSAFGCQGLNQTCHSTIVILDIPRKFEFIICLILLLFYSTRLILIYIYIYIIIVNFYSNIVSVVLIFFAKKLNKAVSLKVG